MSDLGPSLNAQAELLPSWLRTLLRTHETAPAREARRSPRPTSKSDIWIQMSNLDRIKTLKSDKLVLFRPHERRHLDKDVQF